MIRFKYKKAKSDLGEILRPIAEVILETDKLKIEVPMYIDSGADVTMIPLRLGRALGFTQMVTDVIREIRGIGGSGIPYILKEVFYVFNNKKVRGKIAWALIEETPLLLGRMDIFNKFRIIFDERSGWIDFEQNENE